MTDTNEKKIDETKEVIEDEGENEMSENEPVGGEEEIQGPDHPIDILMGCIDSIDTQFKRLKNNRCGDLKYELKHNIYPIIKNGFTAIIDYLDAMEEDEEDGDEIDEPPPEVKEAIQKSFEEVKNLCNNILALDAKLAGAAMPEPYSKILAWAKENKPKFDEAEKIETSAKATVDATVTVNATAEKKE